MAQAALCLEYDLAEPMTNAMAEKDFMWSLREVLVRELWCKLLGFWSEAVPHAIHKIAPGMLLSPGRN